MLVFQYTLSLFTIFLGNRLNIPYFTYTAKENWKEGCNPNNALNFSIPTCRYRTLTPHWICWFSNIQASQPAKSSIQFFFNKKNLFSPTSTYLTLDPLPLVIISTLFYMNWLDKRGHYMWWYCTCKHVSLF